MTALGFIFGTLFGFAMGLLVSRAENQWYWRGVRGAHDDGTADRSEG